LSDRFLHNRFSEGKMATVGAAFGSTKLVVEGKEVILGLWDTAGAGMQNQKKSLFPCCAFLRTEANAEKFRSMTRIYYKGAAVAILW